MPQHPPINFAELQIDPERLERALALNVEAFEGHDESTGEVIPQPGCYSVTPASAASEKQGIVGYWVDLYSHDVPRCDCGDHTYRDTICKHMLACLLHEGHPVVVRALIALTRRLEEDLRGQPRYSREVISDVVQRDHRRVVLRATWSIGT